MHLFLFRMFRDLIVAVIKKYVRQWHYLNCRQLASLSVSYAF